MEFLREEQAHVRLGFSDRQIADWFKEAGLEQVETVAFKPAGQQGLTVKLWAGRDRRILLAQPGAERRHVTETA
jgi:hypothetical protein